MNDDARWMGAALALARRGMGRTAPNPSVGCVLVRDGHVVGRGWTQPGGRPHAEAQALAMAGDAARGATTVAARGATTVAARGATTDAARGATTDAARGATAYVTLEPCAHVSPRGPACSDLLIAAGVARVVVAMPDADPRTHGIGLARLQAAGIATSCDVRAAEAAAINAGFLSRQRLGRPYVTLKLALSLDGCIALADGTSRWITGPLARAHAHRERSLADMIIIGRGTLEADDPALDVRLAGLEARAPQPAVLSRTLAGVPAGLRLHGASVLHDLAELDARPDISAVLIEGGAGLATALLAADRIDRLLIYRAPIILGGRPGVGDIELGDLAAAHGRWRLAETRHLAPDRLEVYQRTRG